MKLSEFKDLIIWVAFWYLAGTFLAAFAPFGRDVTDSSWPARSGLRLYTDAETGCQYLSNANGGMALRVDAQGKHMGCK